MVNVIVIVMVNGFFFGGVKEVIEVIVRSAFWKLKTNVFVYGLKFTVYGWGVRVRVWLLRR